MADTDEQWSGIGDSDFAKLEEGVLGFWDTIDAFNASLEMSKTQPSFMFYDGPPFATGLPHYGHLLAGTIKDIVLRYKTQTGHHAPRRFGWDCHGLPVEYEIDKAHNVKGREDVMAMGIDKYNGLCRAIVNRYCNEWRDMVRRTGRWVDMDNDYRTMEPQFMESVWWVFKQLFDKGLVYRGHRVMPYSTACKTPLSNFEAMQNYKDVNDPAVVVAFEIVDGGEDWLRGVGGGAAIEGVSTVERDAEAEATVERTRMLAWTTTPWTLPSNLGLLVSATGTYARVLHMETKTVNVVSTAAVAQLGKWLPPMEAHRILSVHKGAEMKGTSYKPLYEFFEEAWRRRGAFRIIEAAFVGMDEGTGVVHAAPGFGADDHAAFVDAGVIRQNEAVPCPVDAAGCFTKEVSGHEGVYVKDADKAIVRELKVRGHIVNNATVMHSYPFCWRSDTPLLYRTVSGWFVRVADHVPLLLQTNSETHWAPEFVQERRFKNWLSAARDWSVSRNRYWGTPIPLWTSGDGQDAHVVCVGSTDELFALSGVRVTDLHREHVDHITWVDSEGRTMRRVEEVLDCWFESGCVPYASRGHPRQGAETFDTSFPADFIAEGLDQTRGWFYTLHVIAALLLGRPAFRNVIVNGLILAADGKKMSKRLKNYPEPRHIIDLYGADAMRIYIVNSPAARAEAFRFEENGVRAIARDVLRPWLNATNFLLTQIDAMRQHASLDLSSFRVPDLSASTIIASSQAENAFVLYGSENSSARPSNTTDRWIRSQSSRLLTRFHHEMNAYRLFSVLPALLSFLEMLTNIYIRFNRRRLKCRVPEQVADTSEALRTLLGVLMQLTLMMAPVAPFFAEVVYQRLRLRICGQPPSGVVVGNFDASAVSANVNASSSDNASLSVNSLSLSHGCSMMPRSVHLAQVPQGDPKDIDTEAEAEVDMLRQIIEAARTIRETNHIALAIRLPGISVVRLSSDALPSAAAAAAATTDPAASPAAADNPLMRQYIMHETNVASVTFCTKDSSHLAIAYKPTPNWKLLGIRLKAHLRDIQVALKTLTTEQLERFLQDGHITVGGHALMPNELDVVRVVTPPAGHAAIETPAANCAVVLDMTVLPHNVRLGHIRNLLGAVNKLKKAARLVPGESFVAFYVLKDDPENYLHTILASEDITSDEVLSHLAPAGETNVDDLATATVTINNSTIQLWARKA